jgi:hypothetical protein
VEHFHSVFNDAKLPCIHCKELKPASICSFCYIKEATEWLTEKNSDFKDELRGMLSISGDSKMTFHPITHTKDVKPGEGICEHCGLFSYELYNQNGNWLCKECEDLES